MFELEANGKRFQVEAPTIEHAVAAVRGGPAPPKVGAGGVVVDPDAIKERGQLLPFGITESGERVLALPEFLAGPFKTIGDILDGKNPRDVAPSEVLALGALFAGVSPASGTGKFLPGASTGPKPGNAVTAAGERIGVAVPRGVASGTSTVRQAGKIVQAVPGGGQPMRRAAETATKQLGEAATRVEEALGAGSPVRAGQAVESGVTAFAGKGGVLAERASARFNRVDALVNPTMTHALAETAKAAATIGARRKEAAIGAPSKAASLIEQAVTRKGGLTYQGLKTLRTYVGELLDNPSLLPADISGAELKQIYAALTKDLKGAVKAAGGDKALAAWETANKAFQKTMAIRENLARVLKAPSEEAIFGRIEGMAGSTARADIKTLAQVRAAVGKEGWDEVGSALISRIGRDPEGNFSPERFLTGWGKISTEGKRILFETTGNKQHAKALDDIATVSSRFKQLRQFANPSGTGQTIIGAGLGAGGVSAMFGSITAPLTAAGTILGARILSNVLAKPQTAAPFAIWAKAYAAFAQKPQRMTVDALHAASRALAAALAAGDQAKQDQLAKEFATIRQGG
jgi:hypothetical protein